MRSVTVCEMVAWYSLVGSWSAVEVKVCGGVQKKHGLSTVKIRLPDYNPYEPIYKTGGYFDYSLKTKSVVRLFKI